MAEEEEEEEIFHDVVRHFQMGGRHIVMCDCGEKFTADSEREAMHEQFAHAVQFIQEVGF